MAATNRFAPPPRGSQSESRRSVGGSSSTPSLASRSMVSNTGPPTGPEAVRQTPPGATPEYRRLYAPIRRDRRESSSYGWEHKDGYCGHVPETGRNDGKYGKTRTTKRACTPAEYDSAEAKWREDIQTYSSARRTPAPPCVRNKAEPAGVANSVRAKKPDWAEKNITRFQPHFQESNTRRVMGFNFPSGYAGHVPVTDKNRDKYGGTFGKQEKKVESESFGRFLQGSQPPTVTLDRLGREVDLRQDDPRPPPSTNKKAMAMPGMGEELERKQAWQKRKQGKKMVPGKNECSVQLG